MIPFIPAACGIAAALTCVLVFETGKGTQKTIKKRQKRNERKKARH